MTASSMRGMGAIRLAAVPTSTDRPYRLRPLSVCLFANDFAKSRQGGPGRVERWARPMMQVRLRRTIMRAILLAFVLSLFSSSLLQAGALVERYPWLVTKAWYQLCGNNRFLAFDPQFSCCCFTQSTGKHCVR